MNLKKITLAASLFLTLQAFAQDFSTKPQSNISYLDSIKKTFIKDNIASCVDSLWLKELTSLDLYNDLEADIKTINLDQKVDYELPTELLKARLKEMDSKSPFNIEYNQGLENIIKSFLRNRKKAYERLMAISEYYFPLFEDALAKQNVPLEIKYLAVVESALNPKAVSRVGATGLWQFMYQTGKQYNLNIDSYVDERSDPLKASEAAAQYMTNMYKIFGDWDLVLASYNSGPGNVAKAIRRSGGQQNFWNIRKYLPQETQGYVPAFLATMYIYEYHKEHGIKPNRALVKHFATDTIMIKKQISFKQISDLLDIPVAQLQMLNPQFKLNVVPAYFDTKHYLRLPSEKIAVFTSNEDKIYAYVQHEADQREKPFSRMQQALASRDSSSTQESYLVSRTKFHKVRRGDNLSEIADRYDVSISDIKKWNKLKSNKAPLGRNLKIITAERIAAKAKKVKNDTIAIVPISKTTATAVVEATPKEQKVYKEEKVVSFKDVTKTHKVRKGDSLGEIADKYGVAMSDIKKWNKLKNNNVPLGKKLKIITNERVVTTVRKLVKTDKNEALAAVDKTKKDTDTNEDFYIVEKGDNLSSIAKKYNVTVDDLKKWNNLEDNNIQLESKLKIADIKINHEDQQENEPVVKTEIRNVEYVVQRGDNLGVIARKNNVAVSDLKMWNDLQDDNIQLGDKLIVGKKLIADNNQTIAENSTKKDKAAKKAKENHYYVQKGDSLFSIAKKYPGVTVSDIKKWNGINGNSLKPGMKLKING
ncbi:LysM peptidoglycan-binding domain-containing protein [Flavobacterium sp. CYK-4]|uniref:LysM peptidoglycan-binding domain-containing protein n=1 Tax=Flavobacterium lotistagni TaxID=2709660 RepID=UPI0014088380|nr:LysM peptidoglycan-binding domain-containing protein [Flavobacterium lotistagni]NHM06108.1 LysM peptidoglycan-binding domain-containing protein [Flavobacterium lotistagni]